VSVEVLDRVEVVDALLRERGAAVRRRGHGLEVTTSDQDPYDLINRVLAETGTGIQSLKPSVRTLEDAYFEEGERVRES
jgi:hypothetical protein